MHEQSSDSENLWGLPFLQEVQLYELAMEPILLVLPSFCEASTSFCRFVSHQKL